MPERLPPVLRSELSPAPRLRLQPSSCSPIRERDCSAIVRASLARPGVTAAPRLRRATSRLSPSRRAARSREPGAVSLRHARRRPAFAGLHLACIAECRSSPRGTRAALTRWPRRAPPNGRDAWRATGGKPLLPPKKIAAGHLSSRRSGWLPWSLRLATGAFLKPIQDARRTVSAPVGFAPLRIPPRRRRRSKATPRSRVFVSPRPAKGDAKRRPEVPSTREPGFPVTYPHPVPSLWIRGLRLCGVRPFAAYLRRRSARRTWPCPRTLLR